MALVRDFVELDVYRLALELQRDIYEISNGFPKDEKYSLTDQIRRSSRSIGANIAESWAKRRYKAHFVSKLTDADGEQLETRHWIRTAFSSGYISEKSGQALDSKCQDIGRKLGSMMANVDRWCSHF